MNEELKQAIKLVRENGYIVKKVTEGMKRDCDKCQEMSENGEDMECFECAYSICIMQ
jgi:hypothetical protein